jgi:endonuclease-3
MESLTALAGVGRKTANVVLGNAFQITSGIVVDTHVTRLANRFGWTKSENPVLIEEQLQKIIPSEDWILISHLLISQGRAVCKARSPACERCFLADHCPQRR